MSLFTRSHPYKNPLWYRVSRVLRAIVLYAILLFLCAIILLLPTEHWHWENFIRALTNPNQPFLIFTFNTLKIFIFNVIGSVLSCTMVAFAFARLRFRGSNFLFNFLIITMLIPWAVLMIPSFIMFNKIGWYGTYLPLIVPAFFGNAFFIFMIRQYMRTIPKELDEAALIDGASYFQIYWRIILPISMPVVAVQIVFLFLGAWGDLLGPLIYLTRTDQFTVAIGLANFATRANPNNNLLMAANLIMMIPPIVLYFFAQEKLVGGIASMGLKG